MKKHNITRPLAYYVNLISMPVGKDEFGNPMTAYGYLRRLGFNDARKAFAMVQALRRIRTIVDDFETARQGLAEKIGVQDIIHARLHGEPVKMDQRWQAFEDAITDLIATTVTVEVPSLTVEELQSDGEAINALVAELLEPWLAHHPSAADNGVSGAES